MSALDEEESADAKTRREDVLNQLMTLLNTAYTSGKKTEVEGAAAQLPEVDERPRTRISTQQQQVGYSLSLVMLSTCHARCSRWRGDLL